MIETSLYRPKSWWEKMGILARSLPGNLSIWREILTFEIKKYIRNSGKFDFLAGKNTFFQAVAKMVWWWCFSLKNISFILCLFMIANVLHCTFFFPIIKLNVITFKKHFFPNSLAHIHIIVLIIYHHFACACYIVMFSKFSEKKLWGKT